MPLYVADDAAISEQLKDHLINELFQLYNEDLLISKLLDLEVSSFIIINHNTAFVPDRYDINLIKRTYPEVKIIDKYSIEV